MAEDPLSAAIRKATEQMLAAGATPDLRHLSLPSPLPHETCDEPVRARKAAWVVAAPGGAAFSPLTCTDGSRRYGSQAVAECLCNALRMSLWNELSLSPPHLVPGPDTKCGFYARKHGERFPPQPGTWLLEVELYGTVVEHEHGYRAQKQRVLSASPVPGVFCGPPARLALSTEPLRVIGACEDCPACNCHPVPVDRLRAMLGTEIDMTAAWKLMAGQGRPA